MTPEQFESMKAFNAKVAKAAEEKKQIATERNREKNKRWRLANPERAHELSVKWRTENRKKVNKSSSDYRKLNPEKVRETKRNWYKENYIRSYEKSHAWAKANPERTRENARKSYLKRKYGLTIEERDAMLKAQGGCASCGATEPGGKNGWHVDHCHITGIVRGILCHQCNVALGQVNDSLEHLHKLIAYLERFTRDQHCVQPVPDLRPVYEIGSLHPHDLRPCRIGEDHCSIAGMLSSGV
jgi:hypothetical protein